MIEKIGRRTGLDVRKINSTQVTRCRLLIVKYFQAAEGVGGILIGQRFTLCV
ncbi:hypothetical protein DPMN_130873 [Dreissena polymorpha]|uniref:Uncharacterized protein n=1 Tax=Dreissena polymorpha TaxID=45954 RepID=A0A9D4K218_DREPO|nr:hypothetical protein DPMN_130873 [Dreissena polymorpha]